MVKSAKEPATPVSSTTRSQQNAGRPSFRPIRPDACHQTFPLKLSPRKESFLTETARLNIGLDYQYLMNSENLKSCTEEIICSLPHNDPVAAKLKKTRTPVPLLAHNYQVSEFTVRTVMRHLNSRGTPAPRSRPGRFSVLRESPEKRNMQAIRGVANAHDGQLSSRNLARKIKGRLVDYSSNYTVKRPNHDP